MTFDVITIGGATIDIFVKSDQFQESSESGKISLCQITDSKIEAQDFFVSSGGGATNTAVGFSRFGFSTACIAEIGKDSLSSLVVEDLKNDAVSTDLLVCKDGKIDTTLILLSKNANRAIVVYRGKTRIEESDVRFDQISSGWIYLTSMEGNIELIEKIINFARDKGIKVAWNPGARELHDSTKVKTLSQSVEIFNVNKEEMETLLNCKMSDENFWNEAGKISSKYVIVTDGRQGAYCISDGRRLYLPSPTTSPIDETGAGDAFGSGFVIGLLKGLDTKSAFELAMRQGAAVVQHLGAKEGLQRN